MRNTFGNLFALTTFGESHGPAIGGVVDGMPAGIDIDVDFIQSELNRRRPGQSKLTTSRNETDQVELLSGVFEGKSTGTPIGFVVRNANQHSKDYDNMRSLFRPSHADYTYYNKYGLRDHRGGGRSSARITLARVVGGALAKLALRQMGVTISAYVSQVGDIALEKDYRLYDLSNTENNDVRCPDEEQAKRMAQLILETKNAGRLGYAMLSINAAKGFEIGDGFDLVGHKGSEVNDVFVSDEGQVSTLTNHSGGIQGGISNGQDIFFRVAFKPVATVLMEQDTIEVDGTPTTFAARGRHDSCVVPRAVPIVEAMAAMVLMDNLAMAGTRIDNDGE